MEEALGELGFSLSADRDFEDRELASKVLHLMVNGPEFCMPKRYGTGQPAKQVVRRDHLGDMIELWMQGGASETGKIASVYMEFCREGYFAIDWAKGLLPTGRQAGFNLVHGGIPTARLSGGPADLQAYLDHILQLADLVDPVFGMIHNTRTPHWETPYDLTLRLPDVPWGSLYGRPYIELIGRNRILNAPFFRVQELRDGLIFGQLTESVLEPNLPLDRRAAVRQWLGEEAFMEGPKPPRRYKSGRAPKFQFAV